MQLKFAQHLGETLPLERERRELKWKRSTVKAIHSVVLVCTQE